MIINYKLIECSMHDDLEYHVKTNLREGWELHGDTQVVLMLDGVLKFFQAMVKTG